MHTDTDAEVSRLRAALRDLVAISSIPASWVGREPLEIASGLADVLLGSLDLHFVFVRLCDPKGGASVEVTRGGDWPSFPEWLAARLVSHSLSHSEIVGGTGGRRPSPRGMVMPIGVNAECGLVAAASRRAGFPNEIDQMLLSVAANHAAASFKDARLRNDLDAKVKELRQTRNHLEITVAERTANLTTTNEELRRQREQLDRLFELSPVAVILTDENFQVLRVNQEFTRMFGYAPEETIGRPLFELIVPEDFHEESEKIVASVLGGERLNLESVRQRKDGVRLDVSITAAPLSLGPGQTAVYLIYRDITEHKRAQDDLRRSEAYLAEAQRVSHTGSFGWCVSSGLIYWSEETFRIMELDQSTKPTVELVLQRTHPEDRPFVLETLDRAAHAREVFDFEHRLLMPDCSIKYVRVVGHPSTTDDSSNFEFVGAVTDITERRRAEENLRQSEAYLAEAQRLAHMGSWAWQVAGRTMLHASEQYYRIADFDPEEDLPGWEERKKRLHPEDLEKFEAALKRALEAKSDFEIEARHSLRDGTVRHIHSVGHPVLDASGNVVQFVGFSMDITERKRAEEALREAERRLRDVIETIPTMAWTARPDGANDFANQRWLEYTGLTLTNTSGSGWASMLHPADTARHLERWRASLASGRPFENEARIRRAGDGEYRWFLHRAVALHDEHDRVVKWYGTATDIEDRRRAEDALRRSEGYLAEAQKLSRSGSWAWNVLTDTLFWSQEIFRIFECDPEEITPTFPYLLERVHPEDRERIEQRRRMESTKKEWADSEVDYRIVFADGRIKYMHSVAHPVTDESGRTTEIVGTIMDVTERRRADEEREKMRQLEADLMRISRVTTIGELTASLAHELNQPIAAAITDATTCLSWLKRDQPDIEEACEAASRLVHDATHAADIISRTRLMFTKGNAEQSLVSVNEVVQQMTALLRHELARHSIAIETTLAEDIAFIMGDPVQLQQVVMNLAVNAIEAMKDIDGSRKLAISSRQVSEEEILLSVSDTGIGLPQEKGRVFDAFYTTKAHGTGMGLRISRSIVEAHGGRLWAADNSPRGAIFHLTLPAVIKTHQ